MDDEEVGRRHHIGRRTHGWARNEDAQGLTEFGIIAMLLLILFLGAVDFGRFLYYRAAIQAAARMGAETASNHCPVSGSSCGTTTTATSDTFVQWKTYCEAESFAMLKPSYSSCSPGSTQGWTPTCSSSCTGCTFDVCVSPTTRSSGTSVTVSVGYSFKPVSFLMAPFFNDISCFSGDSTSSNHHTLCASAVGRVS